VSQPLDDQVVGIGYPAGIDCARRTPAYRKSASKVSSSPLVQEKLEQGFESGGNRQPRRPLMCKKRLIFAGAAG